MLIKCEQLLFSCSKMSKADAEMRQDAVYLKTPGDRLFYLITSAKHVLCFLHSSCMKSWHGQEPQQASSVFCILGTECAIDYCQLWRAHQKPSKSKLKFYFSLEEVIVLRMKQHFTSTEAHLKHTCREQSSALW